MENLSPERKPLEADNRSQVIFADMASDAYAPIKATLSGIYDFAQNHRLASIAVGAAAFVAGGYLLKGKLGALRSTGAVVEPAETMLSGARFLEGTAVRTSALGSEITGIGSMVERNATRVSLALGREGSTSLSIGGASRVHVVSEATNIAPRVHVVSEATNVAPRVTVVPPLASSEATAVSSRRVTLLPRETGPVGEPKPSLLGNIDAIKNTAGEIPLSREHLAELVEEPLRPACQALFDRNVRTLSTTANGVALDYHPFASIAIDYESLSAGNKVIAQRLGPVVDGSLELRFAASRSTSVADLQQKSLQAALQFEQQPLTWAPKFDWNGFRGVFALDHDYPMAELIHSPWFKSSGWHYDANSSTFHLSRQLFEQSLKI